jgi:hypothetical protein
MEVQMPFHAHSLFTAGPRSPLTIGDRALWLARLHTARLTHSVTAGCAEVARALLRRLGPDGRLDPSHATLAADTGNSVRTVSRALRQLADVGLLTWQRRLVRQGWRAAQTSNAYALVPAGAAIPPLRIKERGSSAKMSVAGAARSVEQQIAAALAWAGEWKPRMQPARIAIV